MSVFLDSNPGLLLPFSPQQECREQIPGGWAGPWSFHPCPELPCCAGPALCSVSLQAGCVLRSPPLGPGSLLDGTGLPGHFRGSAPHVCSTIPRESPGSRAELARFRADLSPGSPLLVIMGHLCRWRLPRPLLHGLHPSNAFPLL